jgi:hypothetical protein
MLRQNVDQLDARHAHEIAGGFQIFVVRLWRYVAHRLLRPSLLDIPLYVAGQKSQPPRHVLNAVSVRVALEESPFP